MEVDIEIGCESNAEYHSDYSHVSWSMLEVFRRSPIEYAARFVHGTMNAPAPTPQMALGTALHVQILEAHKWDERIAVVPNCDRRTTEGKKTWLDFMNDSKGKTVIMPDQSDAVVSMAKSVCHHPEVRELMLHAWKKEQAVRGMNSLGVPVKSKFDLICTGPIIVDFKTTFDPSPDGFARSAANLGYHRQAAFYIDLAKMVFGKDYRFVHVAVQNCEPWECAAYYLDKADIELGRVQNARDMRRLRECYETDEWISPQNAGILKLKLPKWASFVE